MKDALENLKHRIHKIFCRGPCCGEPKKMTKAEWYSEFYFHGKDREQPYESRDNGQDEVR